MPTPLPYLFCLADPLLVILDNIFSDRETLGALILITILVVFLTSIESLLISHPMALAHCDRALSQLVFYHEPIEDTVGIIEMLRSNHLLHDAIATFPGHHHSDNDHSLSPTPGPLRSDAFDWSKILASRFFSSSSFSKDLLLKDLTMTNLTVGLLNVMVSNSGSSTIGIRALGISSSMAMAFKPSLSLPFLQPEAPPPLKKMGI